MAAKRQAKHELEILTPSDSKGLCIGHWLELADETYILHAVTCPVEQDQIQSATNDTQLVKNFLRDASKCYVLVTPCNPS